MTPQEFINKWQAVTLSERSACQQHFLDLCELLGQPKPAAADPDGAWYTFERGVSTTTGGKGWADVWMRGRFGWEYKGKHKDLDAAYQQLLRYREDLENPPLLVVCDMDRFQIHTNFTGTAKQVHAFDLDGLADPRNLDVLRKLFSDPEALKPGETTASITERAAKEFAKLADGMRERGIEPHRAAHFLMKLMFCKFAEDIHLLPDDLFTKVLSETKSDPQKLAALLGSLFQSMSSGGMFGADEILHFNGGLFKDADVIELTPAEIRFLCKLNEDDWSNVEPSIFGTLFERTLDPAKRSQIGAHYTSREDIETLLRPVMMVPLRREWDEVRTKCEKLTGEIAKAKTTETKRKKIRQREKALRDFVERLADVKVLDPACGSGNFLYVAIHLLLDLEKEVISYAATRQLGLIPQVRPTQLAGIEINPYAQELAQVVIWIGFLQWMYHNGFQPPRKPVLEPFESIVNKDAILDLSDPESPKEPEWPAADFIVGNPPFLGGNRVRQAMGDEYVDALFSTYKDRVPGFADICCYWFEKARANINAKSAHRAGLLATQGIRGGMNRKVLDRIKASGDIFFGMSDRNWILDGAMVHVSMVGFDSGLEAERVLDNRSVAAISASLSSGIEITRAGRFNNLKEVHIEGVKKGADFELQDAESLHLLDLPNPNGRPNSDAIRPYCNGLELYGGATAGWVIYFAPTLPKETASQYEAPFEKLVERVYPKYGSKRRRWWLHERPRPELATMLSGMRRYLATVKHSKHRLFVWVPAIQLVSNAIELFAYEDDYFLGVLHARVHEVWARAPGMGTQVRERESGFRYTPTTCFETFPFPAPTDTQRAAIAEAARELDGLRSNWLNPCEWTREELLEFPGSVDGPWSSYIDRAEVAWARSPCSSSPKSDGGPTHGEAERESGLGGRDTGEHGLRAHATGEHGLRAHATENHGLRAHATVGTVRYPRIVAKDDECAKKLKKRTLTNLYNERPTWLDLAHKKLDAAVFAAYGWQPDLSDDDLLAKLLELNLERAAAEK